MANYTWLRPLLPALTSPGGPVQRLLDGSMGHVGSIAITRDGKRVVAGILKRRKYDEGEKLLLWDLEANRMPRVVADKAGIIVQAIAENGRLVICSRGGWDSSELVVWNLENDQPLWVWEGRQVALATNGNRAVTVSEDDALAIWDLYGNHALQQFKALGPIRAVAISADGKRVLTGSGETVQIWDLDGNEPPRMFKVTGTVSSVMFTSDGGGAIVGSDNGMWLIWCLKSNELIRMLPRMGRATIAANGKRAIRGDRDGTLRIWDLDSDQPARMMKRQGPITAVAITADGERAITGGDEGALRVWDLAANQAIPPTENHEQEITSLAVTTNGTLGFSCSRDGTIRQWELEGTPSSRVISQHISKRYIEDGLAIAADAKRAVGGYGTLQEWDLRGNQPPRILKVHPGGTDESGLAFLFAISANGRRAISAEVDDWDVSVWELESNKPPLVLDFSGDCDGPCVTELAIDAQGERAILSFAGRSVLVSNLAEREPDQILMSSVQSLGPVAISADGKFAISGSKQGIGLVWDLEIGPSAEPHCVGKIAREFEVGAGAITAVALTGDGQRGVFAGDDRTVQVWDLGKLQPMARFSLDYTATACAAGKNMILVGDVAGNVHVLNLEE